ncbi:hypothetical protein ACZ90_14695 [Streptomyces albus subsp. albus]|nr:hypothetical protein ACZ90_14695 [Streptomyces albus subsp. albus]
MPHQIEDLPALPVPRLQECPFGPPPEMAAFRESPGLTRVQCPTGITAWLITRYEDVREVLGDSERFSSRPGQAAHVLVHMNPDLPIGEGEFTRMDGPEYQRFRRHLGPEIGMPKRLEELRPTVRRIVDERLDLMAAAGSADFYADFAIPVTTTVIGGLLGVPYSDRKLFHDSAAAMFGSATSESGLKAGTKPLFEYVHGLIRERRENPGEDAVSRMIQRSANAAEPFTDTELMRMSAGLLTSGWDTTATVMTHGLLALLAHPEELDRLRADHSLVPAAVEELARYFGGAPGLTREVVQDTEIGGHPVAKGDFVVLAVQAADRDPAAFEDPDRLDVGRQTTGHLGFGYGPHQCIGQQTARLELTVTLETLLRRVPTLRLAVPLSEIRFKTGTPVYGPAALPIAWDAILPAEEGR